MAKIRDEPRKMTFLGQLVPCPTKKNNADLVPDVRRAGCISQDTYLIHCNVQLNTFMASKFFK